MRHSLPQTAHTHPQNPGEKDTFALVGAGDIASCKESEGAKATANLIEKIPGTVFAAGDLAYERGSQEEFKNCYKARSKRAGPRSRLYRTDNARKRTIG